MDCYPCAGPSPTHRPRARNRNRAAVRSLTSLAASIPPLIPPSGGCGIGDRLQLGVVPGRWNAKARTGRQPPVGMARKRGPVELAQEQRGHQPIEIRALGRCAPGVLVVTSLGSGQLLALVQKAATFIVPVPLQDEIPGRTQPNVTTQGRWRPHRDSNWFEAKLTFQTAARPSRPKRTCSCGDLLETLKFTTNPLRPAPIAPLRGVRRRAKLT